MHLSSSSIQDILLSLPFNPFYHFVYLLFVYLPLRLWLKSFFVGRNGVFVARSGRILYGFLNRRCSLQNEPSHEEAAVVIYVMTLYDEGIILKTIIKFTMQTFCSFFNDKMKFCWLIHTWRDAGSQVWEELKQWHMKLVFSSAGGSFQLICHQSLVFHSKPEHCVLTDISKVKSKARTWQGCGKIKFTKLGLEASCGFLRGINCSTNAFPFSFQFQQNFPTRLPSLMFYS